MNDVQQLWERTPKKLVAVATAAAAGAVVDRRLLLTQDLKDFFALTSVLMEGKRVVRERTLMPDVFADAVRKWPKKEFLACDGRALTFEEVDAISNRIAHWALRQGLHPGDRVALLMENRVEYVVVWLGLLKVGVVTALINTNLVSDGLLHCIKTASPKLVIVGSELLETLGSIVPQLDGLSFHVYGDGVSSWETSPLYPFAQSLDEQLESLNASLPTKEIRVNAQITPTDSALLIYTSGTTGLPKAARVNHFNLLMRSRAMQLKMGADENDRLYTSLPLYHTSGGNLAVAICLYAGATLCISKRFSASRFWTDVARYDATIIQYIGEMCRYLVNAPPTPTDKVNNVRTAFGNGLRPDVWDEFQDRFQIPVVYEFYGSTEGVMGFANYCETVEGRGHLGRRGFLMQRLLGARIVRFDVEKDELIRGKDGMLQECAFNEVGELLNEIKEGDAARKFSGYYRNDSASNKKVIRDVFVKGDVYFRTGDLFKIDDQRRWHFVDRIGDTFRWKGENVATNEVAEAISKFEGLSDLCVYGVEVPGNEGRACMAAMVFDEANFDMHAFAQHVKARLPSYAVPLFLRQLGAMSMTGTVKYEKAKMRKEGMDPSKVQEKLWYYAKDKNTYERLTPESYHQVVTSSRL